MKLEPLSLAVTRENDPAEWALVRLFEGGLKSRGTCGPLSLEGCPLPLHGLRILHGLASLLPHGQPTRPAALLVCSEAMSSSLGGSDLDVGEFSKGLLCTGPCAMVLLTHALPFSTRGRVYQSILQGKNEQCGAEKWQERESRLGPGLPPSFLVILGRSS